jgi:hypothetical protein
MEQHIAVHFLRAKGHLAIDMQKDVLAVYGKNGLLCKAVYNWVKKSAHGYSKLEDNDRPDHPAEIKTVWLQARWKQ